MQESNVVTPKKSSQSSKIILMVLAILILVGGIIAGVILVGQQQLFRQKAATTYQVCSGDACTDCILNNRPDILPFYEQNGWSTACSEQTRIVNNWCGSAVDLAGCRAIKQGVCATSCTSAVTRTTPSPTPRRTSSPRPTTTPIGSPTATPKKTTKPLATGSELPSAEDLPVSGVSGPTIIGVGAGVILLIGALLLAI